MKELNAKQLKAMEQIAINAGTVVLGTLILGWAIAPPHSFRLIYFLAGIMIYGALFWIALKVNERK